MPNITRINSQIADNKNLEPFRSQLETLDDLMDNMRSLQVLREEVKRGKKNYSLKKAFEAFNQFEKIFSDENFLDPAFAQNKILSPENAANLAEILLDKFKIFEQEKVDSLKQKIFDFRKKIEEKNIRNNQAGSYILPAWDNDLFSITQDLKQNQPKKPVDQKIELTRTDSKKSIVITEENLPGKEYLKKEKPKSFFARISEFLFGKKEEKTKKPQAILPPPASIPEEPKQTFSEINLEEFATKELAKKSTKPSIKFDEFDPLNESEIEEEIDQESILPQGLGNEAGSQYSQKISDKIQNTILTNDDEAHKAAINLIKKHEDPNAKDSNKKTILDNLFEASQSLVEKINENKISQNEAKIKTKKLDDIFSALKEKTRDSGLKIASSEENHGNFLRNLANLKEYAQNAPSTTVRNANAAKAATNARSIG